MATTTAAGGLMGWINSYGNMVFFIGQVIFWLVMCVAAVWATLIFRRSTNARIAHWAGGDMTSKGRATPAVAATGTSVADAPAAKLADKPSIDEFVD